MSSPARPVALAALLAAVLAAGCSVPDPPSPAPGPAPASTPAATIPSAGPGSSVTSAAPAEPTTTNTLPAPPRPTGPAPTTAGPLTAAALPVPTGWRTVEPPGNEELGQAGNGNWVQAADPRYAALGAVSIGCAQVTRDDYPDPTAALQGGYANRAGDPGVGLALEFASAADASAYWSVYLRGVHACAGGRDGISISRVREPAVPGGRGLVDRRTDETQEPTDWTEVGVVRGARVLLVDLGDPGHRITDAAADALLARIPR